MGGRDARDKGDGDPPDTSTLRRDKRHSCAWAEATNLKSRSWLGWSLLRAVREEFGLQMVILTLSFLLCAPIFIKTPVILA